MAPRWSKAGSAGNSSAGKPGSSKLVRPDWIWSRWFAVRESCTVASGMARTIWKRLEASTVSWPVWETFAARSPMKATSVSVAVRRSPPSRACRSTWLRSGWVLRRSMTPWTLASPRLSSSRSM